jgi:hypothetical protein
MIFTRVFAIFSIFWAAACSQALADDFKGCALPGMTVSEFSTSDEATLDCVRAIFEVEKTQASNLQLLITSITLLNQKLGEVAASSESLAAAIDEQQDELRMLMASSNATAVQSEAHLKTIVVAQGELQRIADDSLTELKSSKTIVQSLRDALSTGTLRIVIQDN